jgi:hypothetical protein
MSEAYSAAAPKARARKATTTPGIGNDKPPAAKVAKLTPTIATTTTTPKPKTATLESKEEKKLSPPKAEAVKKPVALPTKGKKQKISIANLRPEHGATLDYYIQVKCVSKEKVRKIFIKKQSRDSALFTCTFADAAGKCIRFEAWAELAEQFDTYFEVGEYYKISNMTVVKTNDYDKTRYPGLEYKLSGKADIDLEAIESVSFAGPKVKVEPSIKSLSDLYLKFEAGELKTNNCNVIGIVLEHGAVKSGTSKAGKDYCLSKLTIGDHTLTAIETTIWGEADNKTRYKLGQFVLMENTQVAQNQGNLELKYGNIIVLDPKQKHSTPEMNALMEWYNLNPKNISVFSNLSTANRGASGAAGSKTCMFTTAMQLQHWKKQALDKIKEWKDSGLLQMDADGGCENKLPAELVAELPSGTYKLIGEVIGVSDTNVKDDRRKVPSAYTSTILYPACSNAEVHGRFKARVENNSGIWHCKNPKCGKDSETCVYGCLANIEFMDLHQVTLRSWTLKGLLPEDLTLEQLIAEVKILQSSSGKHTTRDSDAMDEDAEPGDGDSLSVDPDDHIALNESLVQNIKYHSTNTSKMLQATIQIQPDLYQGLLFNVDSFTTPDFEAENEYLTEYIQSQE